jgi:chemotaxis protein MotA
MDLGTLAGVIFGILLIVFSIKLGGDLGSFIDIPSVLCVFGGTFAALAINYPIPKILSILKVTKKTLMSGSLALTPWYQTIVELATVARRDGILALEDKIESLGDEFLKKGLQMLVDGNPADVVSEILEQEIENMEARHGVGHAIWKSIAAYAPAFGMIGTLIGLVLMLKNMSDPSSIGAGLAVALITTFYGAVVANLIASPLQGKLEQRTAEEVHLKKMLLAGILAIQAGDSPRVVGDKLLVFLSPEDKLKVSEKKGE